MGSLKHVLIIYAYEYGLGANSLLQLFAFSN